MFQNWMVKFLIICILITELWDNVIRQGCVSHWGVFLSWMVKNYLPYREQPSEFYISLCFQGSQGISWIISTIICPHFLLWVCNSCSTAIEHHKTSQLCHKNKAHGILLPQAICYLLELFYTNVFLALNYLKQ